MTAFEEYMNEIMPENQGVTLRRRQLYAIPRIRHAKEDFEAGYQYGYEKALSTINKSAGCAGEPGAR
ncbi:hypothetical protein [Rouxiella chamberiensis]|uniref:Uncharacterized protein n=1 Tax=Rouxiella chamberiensis TaxID=1513468 RepID=A0ABY7HLV2_9GAMM|nr:hypothetical protein [Rouxiella chamberiensis]WAT00366.1 hypothetical protein O1V66_15635 [Rouxiella chamberiensis]